MDDIENRAKCTGQCMMSQKAKAQYSLPPCSNQFRLAPFKLKILFTFFTKQATLMWRSNVLSLPLRFVFPG